MTSTTTIKAAHRSDRRKEPELHEYRPLTLEEVKAWGDWPSGQELFVLDRGGRMANVRRNGKVKTWKRDPSRVEIPVKYGLYEAWRITDPGELYVRV